MSYQDSYMLCVNAESTWRDLMPFCWLYDGPYIIFYMALHVCVCITYTVYALHCMRAATASAYVIKKKNWLTRLPSCTIIALNSSGGCHYSWSAHTHHANTHIWLQCTPNQTKPNQCCPVQSGLVLSCLTRYLMVLMALEPMEPWPVSTSFLSFLYVFNAESFCFSWTSSHIPVFFDGILIFDCQTLVFSENRFTNGNLELPFGIKIQEKPRIFKFELRAFEVNVCICLSSWLHANSYIYLCNPIRWLQLMQHLEKII